MIRRVLHYFSIIGMVLLLFTSTAMANEFQLAVPDSVTLISPNGGESFVAGNEYEIKWLQSEEGGLVHLNYSTDSGVTWNVINITQADDTYLWTIPDQVTTKNARIKVVWVEGNQNIYTDISDEDFTITKVFGLELAPNTPTSHVTLISPNGGENLEVGNKYEINWEQSEAVGLVQLEYSTDSGTTWKVISVTQANDTYLWTVPDLMTTTKAKIQVSWYDGIQTYDDSSDADFTITKPLDLQLAPNTAPQAPANLSANAISSSDIILNWEESSNNEAGFKLERKEEGEFTEIAELQVDTTGYLDIDLDKETTYTYRLRAYNNVGNSEYSNEFSAKTLPEPEPEPEIDPLPVPIDPIIIKLYINKAEYYVNDDILTMDTVPVIINSRTLLPIRYVTEALGATIAWDDTEQKVTIEFNDKIIELWINNKDAKVNGILQQIDPQNPSVVPIIVPPGRTMLPVRFIVENLESSIDWDPLIEEVLITYPEK